METTEAKNSTCDQPTQPRIHWDKEEYQWVLDDQDMTVSYGLDGGDSVHVSVEHKDLRRYLYHDFDLRVFDRESVMHPGNLCDRDVVEILDQAMREQKVHVFTDLKNNPTEWNLVVWSGEKYSPEDEVLSILLHPVLK